MISRTLAAVLIASMAFQAIAEDKGGFFDKGFVEGVGGDRPAPFATRAAPVKGPKDPKQAPLQTEDKEEYKDFFGNPIVTPDPSEKKTGKRVKAFADEVEGGLKIKAIELVTTAKDPAKLSASLHAYTNILRGRDINPLRIFIVNNGADPKEAMKRASEEMAKELKILPDAPSSLEEVKALPPEKAQQMLNEMKASPLLPKFMAMAMTLINSFGIPASIPVKALPSWVLYTEEGKVVLEGIIDPTSMITKSGKFVEPVGLDG